MPIAGALPTRNADGTAASNPNRSDNYGGAFTTPLSVQALGNATEGSYFVGITPTSGTGIIGHAAPTTFDETKPYLLLYNSSATKFLYPQFIQFNETVASVGGTVMRFVPVIDNGNRWSSAGTDLTVSNTNGASSIATVATTAKVGAVIATAVTAGVRRYGDIVFRGTTIDIIGDNYTIVFGAPSSNGGASSKVATLIDSSRVAPALAVGPGQSFLLHQWAAGQSTGPTFQCILGWIER
jgi:hypothetical protein